MSIKVLAKNQLNDSMTIDFCCGDKEYRLEPAESQEIEIQDGDCMYFDIVGRMARPEGQRAYPIPNGEWKPFVYVQDDSVTFIGQGGPIKEIGVNGCQIDDLIEFARDVLQVFNQRVPCRETSMMITKLDEALLWSMKRKQERENRQVEGTSQV
jgi:hypothetical protein